MGMNFVFLQVLPLIVGKLLFNTSSVRQMMKKPPRMSKAMGYFPAVYGFGYLMNIIVVIVTFLFFREQALSDTVIVYDSLYIDSPLQVVFLVSYVVILAPLFEEIIYRGIVFEGLKPVGTVFAIFISGFCFALMHANFKQFFLHFRSDCCLHILPMPPNPFFPVFSFILSSMRWCRRNCIEFRFLHVGHPFRTHSFG